MNVRALLLAAAVLPGCAVPKGEVADLRRQVDAMRAQAARDHKQIDELENRILVLEDRVETASVERGRASDAAPRLPVVKKRAPETPDGGEPDPAYTYTDANGEEIEVVYEGAAARDDGPRPRITLHESDRPDDMIPVDDEGDAPPRPRARRTPTPRRDAGYPDPAAVTDRLPVGDKPAPIRAADDPIGVYKAAYAALGRREHDAAIAGFRDFLARWPQHDYADNAQYWLGEAYYDQRDYARGLAEFREVVQRYPDGNKAPDALLKIGYCYAKLGDVASARDVLAQVIEIYPRTDAAGLAAKRLDEMRP